MPRARTAIITAYTRSQIGYDFDAFAGGEQLNLMGFSDNLPGALLIPYFEIAKRESKRTGQPLEVWADEMEKWLGALRQEIERRKEPLL